jgi:hypothetical protein
MRARPQTCRHAARYLVFLFSLFLALTSGIPASAQLARVGPTDPGNGFPQWYQDSTGMALDLCLPNSLELQNGYCVILPPDIPAANSPIAFPGNFPEEAFWWMATTTMDVNGGKAVLVLNTEAAFANGPVVPGDQVSFTRVRVLFDAPSAGHYTVIHPFGVEEFDVTTPGKRAVFFTNDVGIGAPGDFSGPLHGQVTTFLRPSNVPGGDPLPPIRLAGNMHLADFTQLVSITGSPFGTNLFKIIGPDIGGAGVNEIETALFNVAGRVHTAPIPSPLNIDKATYSRDSTGTNIDVYATAKAGIGKPTPLLSVRGTGVDGKVMAKDGTKFYVHVNADSALTPSEVTVTNNADSPPTVKTAAVVDVVSISEASYDPAAKTLTVKASSSDQISEPGFVAEGFGSLNSGSRTFQNVDVVGPTVIVFSSAGGSESKNITTKISAGGSTPNTPIARNDLASTQADTAVSIDVLANDSPAGLVPRILGDGTNGTAVVNPVLDSSGNPTSYTVTYTPNAAFSGSDTFTYIANDPGSGVDSNVATVTVNVAFVNHRPIANPDSVTTGANTPLTIDVAANDSDPDSGGSVQANTVTIVAPPSSGTATVDPATGRITYTPAGVAGTFTLQYTIQDNLGLASLPGTLTINVFAPDRITPGRAQFRTQAREWNIDGTTLIPGPGNVVTIYIGNSVNGTILGTAEADVAGAWRFREKNSSRVPDATRSVTLKSSKGAAPVTVLLQVTN